jgi:16S rRNA processing protein RimM
VFPFGDIQKTFGASGELLLKTRADAPDEINLNEPVFIIMDGLPVPFYFKSFEARGTNRAVVVFDDMESQKWAEEFVGKTLWQPGVDAAATGNRIDVIGYTAYDRQHGELGEVVEVMYIPHNPCLQILYHGRELLVPFHESIVVKINATKRTLETVLPDGLLEIP